jgi:hypothetical protein
MAIAKSDDRTFELRRTWITVGHSPEGLIVEDGRQRELRMAGRTFGCAVGAPLSSVLDERRLFATIRQLPATQSNFVPGSL